MMFIDPYKFVRPRRFWRVVVKAQVGEQGASCAELVMRTGPGGADLCVGGTAISDSVWSPAYNADKAFDKDVNTLWSSTDRGVYEYWIGYELASELVVNQVTWTARNDYWADIQNPTRIMVQSSPDSLVWTDEFASQQDVIWSAGKVVTFPRQ